MTKTKYYDLQMDDPQDDYDVDVVNANLKKIDEQMKTRENATDALQEPEFTVAAKRENIASKEKMPKILGKIAKFFADLKTVAFSGKYNDLDGKPAIVNNNTTTEPGSALDARQANPNIEGTMAASIAQINNDLRLQRLANVTYSDSVTGEWCQMFLYGKVLLCTFRAYSKVNINENYGCIDLLTLPPGIVSALGRDFSIFSQSKNTVYFGHIEEGSGKLELWRHGGMALQQNEHILGSFVTLIR